MSFATQEQSFIKYSIDKTTDFCLVCEKATDKGGSMASSAQKSAVSIHQSK